MTYPIGSHKLNPRVNVATLFENHQLLCEVQGDIPGHAITGDKQLLKLAGTDWVVASWDIVI